MRASGPTWDAERRDEWRNPLKTHKYDYKLEYKQRI